MLESCVNLTLVPWQRYRKSCRGLGRVRMLTRSDPGREDQVRWRQGFYTCIHWLLQVLVGVRFCPLLKRVM